MRRILSVLLLISAPVWAQQAAQPGNCSLCRRFHRRAAHGGFDAALGRRSPSSRPKGNPRRFHDLRANAMVKVTPSVGKPYYLVDRQGDGSFVGIQILRPTRSARRCGLFTAGKP